MTDSPTDTESTNADASEADQSRALRRGFVVAVFVVSALIVPLPFERRLGSAIVDLAHAPLFASLAYGVLRVWNRLRQRDAHVVRRVAMVVVTLILFGGAMEIVQGWLGRSPAWHDAIANSIGAAAGSLWFVGDVLGRSGLGHVRSVCRVVAMGLMMMAWWRPASMLMDVARVRLEFPRLASFESSIELTRWHFNRCRAEIDTDFVTDGNHGMKLTFEASPHPAATLLDVYGDWRDVDIVELDVRVNTVTDQPIELVFKVIDNDHRNFNSDVFRKTFWLQGGRDYALSATRKEIVAGPDSRQLDLAKVKHVSVQILQPSEEVVMHVDAIRVGLQADAS